MRDRNLYQTLGLNNTATQEEIKKAFRFYASKFHPDKHNGDKFFEEKFKEIKDAYEILSDSQKRRAYDSQFIKGSTKEPKNEFSHETTNHNVKTENTNQNKKQPVARENAAAKAFGKSLMLLAAIIFIILMLIGYDIDPVTGTILWIGFFIGLHIFLKNK